jgi:hypothetical protein
LENPKGGDRLGNLGVNVLRAVIIAKQINRVFAFYGTLNFIIAFTRAHLWAKT